MRRCDHDARLKFARGFFLLLFLVLTGHINAQTLNEGRELLLSGEYDQVIRTFERGGFESQTSEEWAILHAQALLARGRYPDAELAVSNALLRFSASIRLVLAGFDTANAAGNTTRAQLRLEQINILAGSRPWAYRDPPNMVALGRAALLMGADAKLVLEQFFDPAQKAAPNLREAWLAAGELALDKGDYALAAKIFSEALKKFPNDPDMHWNLARAFAPGSRGEMLKLISSALEKNPNHAPSLVLLADHLVDAEEFEEADKTLARALKVNPWHPEAWAYRSVLAHLRNDPEGAARFRANALKFWNTNPNVEHLIGRKLSQKYRFAEGAACQRRALAFDENHLPAKIQLAQDLLRLGEEEEGWRLAGEVHARDGYDVTAYNLETLRGAMRTFQTITNDHFILRMSRHEAALYGERALGLLMQARERLTGKYGIELELPTIVEIFPEQKDFAVRTLGVPHNPGFLGVCFGRLVTANSPASQGGDPSNWEAVLWHEFAHVVTLQLTRNKMPRWLSEGISVYEELQANAAWGQTMNPRYREMILGGELKPVANLSAAFLSPKSSLHLQFAYFQSCLVVEFLIERFGFDQLKAILNDLATGDEINDVISRHTAPMEEIEREFAAFAKARAEALGPELDWTKPQRKFEVSGLKFDVPDSNPPPSGLQPPTSTSPSSNYWSLISRAQELVALQEWESAQAALETLIDLLPEPFGANNPYALLAVVHRELGRPQQERDALAKWAARDAAATEAYLRLMELGESARDWSSVAENAQRFLAVNPLIAQPYRYLARAGEALGDEPQAVEAYRKILLLDPPDVAEVHFRLARLLHRAGEPSARGHVLRALEEAPRFREAHRLLLELAAAREEAP